MYRPYNLLSYAAFLKSCFIFLFIQIQILETEATCKLITQSSTEEKLLEKLKPLNGHIFETKDMVKPENYSYKISICDKIVGESDPGTGAAQYTTNGSHHILGRYDEVEILGGNNWMLLKYYGGDAYHDLCNHTKREMHLMIICDPDVLVGQLKILEERNSSPITCFYLFELGSNVSCTVKLDVKPFSSGSVFCILFFTFAILYLSLGFLYKRLVVGAKGLEQIPNYNFWKDFGNLQADGCDYICRCGSRNETQAYRGIDDHLKIEDERDDSMLNM